MSNVIEITDFSAPELDVYARLTEAQLLNRFEPAKGMFIAESPKVIHRAYTSSSGAQKSVISITLDISTFLNRKYSYMVAKNAEKVKGFWGC